MIIIAIGVAFAVDDMLYIVGGYNTNYTESTNNVTGEIMLNHDDDHHHNHHFHFYHYYYYNSYLPYKIMMIIIITIY